VPAAIQKVHRLPVVKSFAVDSLAQAKQLRVFQKIGKGYNKRTLKGTTRLWLITTSFLVFLVVSQKFIPNRHASWTDLGSSLAGILVFGFIVWLLANKGANRNVIT
jgi:hypothetical protein